MSKSTIIKENKILPLSGLHVAIEGNIGAGKTTLAREFVKYCKLKSVNFELYEEPVLEWKNFGSFNTNLLKLMYENPKKHGFEFQVVALLTKCEQLLEYIVNKNSNILVERTIDAQKNIFIPILSLENNLKNYQNEILLRLIDFELKNTKLTPDLIIYLHTTPEIAQQRIMKRNRIEEKDINLLYLQQLHNKYEEWIKNLAEENVIIIDGNKPIDIDSLFELVWNWAKKKIN